MSEKRTYITIDQIKKHLNIDASFTDDDEYLSYLYDVAEAVVQRHICCVLKDLQDETGDIPAPVRHAILLYIGDLYNSRESVTYGGNPVEVPFSYQFLIDLYMNYNDTTSDAAVDKKVDAVASRVEIKDEDLQAQDREVTLDEKGNVVVQIDRI